MISIVMPTYNSTEKLLKKSIESALAQTFIDWVSNMKYLSPKDPGTFVIRRLNRMEYANTLHDLLGVQPEVAFVAVLAGAGTIVFGIIPQPLFDLVHGAGSALVGLF